jgi:hypothetical protein
MVKSPVGSASITLSNDLVARALGKWGLTFSVGELGLASGGRRIRLHTDLDTNWVVPQFIDPII